MRKYSEQSEKAMYFVKKSLVYVVKAIPSTQFFVCFYLYK